MSKTFCPLPWTHQAITPSGNIRLCCVSEVNATTPKAEHMRDVWNSQRMRDIRKQMATGEKVSECGYCYAQEQLNGNSKRIQEVISFSHKNDITTFLEESAVSGFLSPDPMSFDIRFGNLCNLRCKMCSPHSSSMIHKDYKLLKEKNPVVYEELMGNYVDGRDDQWHENPLVWEALRHNITNIEELYFTGGEPTLIDANLDFLEECVRLGRAQYINLRFTTNLTNINARLLTAVKAFKSVKIEMSIDGVGGIQNYIRYPSNWDKILDNMKTLMALDHDSLILSLIFTVQTLNVYHLPDCIDRFFAINEEFGGKHPFATHINPVINPRLLGVQWAPQNLKDAALPKIESWFETFEYKEQLTPTDKTLDYILNSLKNKEDSKHPSELLRYLSFQDQTRKFGFSEMIPDTYKIVVDFLE